MKIGIYGYGNLGRGVEYCAQQNSDVEVVGVFTRRDPASVKTALGTKVFAADDAEKFKEEIDVMIICGGSATDLPELTPKLAKAFNAVDSFDTHVKIPEHFTAVDAAAKKGGKLALISAGWDPGMFSLNRIYSESILPQGETYTFWGKTRCAALTVCLTHGSIQYLKKRRSKPFVRAKPPTLPLGISI